MNIPFPHINIRPLKMFRELIVLFGATGYYEDMSLELRTLIIC
jgi:hypothetical protein